MRPSGTDLPVPAYTKAVAALDEFDATATEYAALLDTHRALLAQENSVAIADTVARGDAIASRAAACGRRLASFREALAGNTIRGQRADTVRERLRRLDHRATMLAVAAAEVASRCEIERSARGAALAQLQRPAGGRSGAYGYPQARRAALTLDTRG